MSNHTVRVLTAVVGIPLILAACFIGGIYFFAFVALISAIALKEFYALSKAKGAQPLVALGLIFGFFVNLSFYHTKFLGILTGLFGEQKLPYPTSQAQFLLIVIITSVAVISLVELFRNKGSALMNLSTTLFGVLYVSLFFGTFIGIREIFNQFDFPMLRYFPQQPEINQSSIDQVYRWGGYTVISIFAMIWICDSAAYYAGSALGKHKLFPRVSPNKSWEGTIAGFIFAIAAAITAKYVVLDYVPLGSAAIIGIIVGSVGQLGDLVESLLKRDAGVKDSSHFIPGHGGVLDRFDSLLLVAPCVYLYLDFVLFA